MDDSKESPENVNVVLFDGVCNLCSGAVQFILEHERSETLKFSSLQSDVGKKLLATFDIDPRLTDSIVYIENNKAFVKSTAAIRIARHLKMPWRIVSKFSFVPRIIRDFIYDLIARNRYKMFGKKEECWLPQPRWKKRFF